MKKIGLVLIFLSISSISFGMASFDTWVEKGGNPGPFAADDLLDLWIKAHIPNSSVGPGGVTRNIAVMGNTIMVDIYVDNVYDPGNNINREVKFASALGPLAPGLYMAVVKVYGNHYIPFWPCRPIPGLLGMAADPFIVKPDCQIPTPPCPPQPPCLPMPPCTPWPPRFPCW